jgi:hypothetical protein
MWYRGKLAGCILFILAACAASESRAQEEEPPAAPPVASKLEVTIDKSKVDLKEHRLEVRMNHVASKVTIKVYDESKAVLADQEHEFAGAPPGSALVVTWSPSTDAPVGRIEVFGYDADGAYKGIAITPWSARLGRHR